MNELLHCVRPAHAVTIRTFVPTAADDRELQRITYRLGTKGAIVDTRMWMPDRTGNLAEVPAPAPDSTETPLTDPDVAVDVRRSLPLPARNSGLAFLGVTWPTLAATQADLRYSKGRLVEIALSAGTRLHASIRVEYGEDGLAARAAELTGNAGPPLVELRLRYDDAGRLRERTIRESGGDVAVRTLAYEDDRVTTERIEDRDGSVTEIQYAYTFNRAGDWIRREAVSTRGGQTVRGTVLVREIEYETVMP